MKTLPLQLIMVGLENGERGVFIGGPLLSEETAMPDKQVDTIWFSNVQEIPDDLTVEKLFQLVLAQLGQSHATVQ